jgi:serpin B
MNRHTLVTVLSLPFLFITGCDDNPTGLDAGELPRELTASEVELVSADNSFGLKLFQAVSEETGDANVFISPLSVSMCLGMVLNGAAGETYTAMQQTLELAALSEDEINGSYQSLIGLLVDLDRRVTVGIANSIWHRDSYPIAPTFVDDNQEYFGAEVTGLDFSAPGAAGIINAWVDQKTRGKIDKIVDDPIAGTTEMFLINAIYFNGNWTYRFDESETRQADFFLADGSTIPVQMMSIADIEVPYYWNEQFESVDLPYGNQHFSMTIIVPRPEVDMDSLIEQMTAEAWDTWMESSHPIELASLEMPRFKLEFEVTLNGALINLGMGIAFGNGADFSRMHADGIPGLFINRVKHKTFIEVDEQGTTAAAVTSTSMATGMPPMMVVNRPFIFAIRERQSGTILFIGKFLEPPQE